MSRALLLAAIMAALAAFPASAAAKGPIELRVCGASGCEVFPPGSPGEEIAFALLDVESAVPLDDFVPAPPLAPYYELRVAADWIDSWLGGPALRYWVPSAGVVFGGANWVRPPASTAADLARVTAGVEPWPAPHLEGVFVAGREVADLAPYAALFGELAPVDCCFGEGVSIRARFDRPAPWSETRLEYVAADRLLVRGSDLVRAPDGLAAAIERDSGIPTATAGSPRPAPAEAFPWEPVAGGVGGAIVLTTALALALARRARWQSRAAGA